MGKEPEMIADDIASTRANLSSDVDALADRVSPARVMDRQVQGVKGRMSNAKDKVMGAAGDASDSVGSMPGNAADSVSEATRTVTDKAEGNPLAAGLIAFGAGWLISSIIPASSKEAQAAGKVVEAAKEHGQPIIDEAKSAGQDMAGELKEHATDAASDLGSSAQESAQHVADEGRSAAQDVKEDTTRS